MKQFIISTEELSKALHTLSFAINPKTVLPVLKNLYCRVSNGNVELVASNLALTVIYRCTVETFTGGDYTFLMPFHLITQIVALNKKQPLKFVVEKSTLKVTGEIDSYNLTSLENVKDYPKVPDIPAKYSLAVDNDFIDLLKMATKSVSKDDKRPAMLHVAIEIKKKKVTVVSTDSHILFMHEFDMDSNDEDELLINTDVIKTINDLDDLKLVWEEKFIAFDSPKATVIATRPDMKYVQFRVVIPQSEVNLTLGRSAIIAALERCGISTEVYGTTTVKLKAEPGKIMFDAHDANTNLSINAVIPGEYTGSAEQVVISSSKLLKLINQVSYDKIGFAIAQSDRAVLLKAEDGPGYTGLIMPIKK